MTKQNLQNPCTQAIEIIENAAGRMAAGMPFTHAEMEAVLKGGINRYMTHYRPAQNAQQTPHNFFKALIDLVAASDSTRHYSHATHKMSEIFVGYFRSDTADSASYDHPGYIEKQILPRLGHDALHRLQEELDDAVCYTRRYQKNPACQRLSGIVNKVIVRLPRTSWHARHRAAREALKAEADRLQPQKPENFFTGKYDHLQGERAPS